MPSEDQKPQNTTTEPLPLEQAAQLMFQIAMIARKSDRSWDAITQAERDKWVTLLVLMRQEKELQNG
jgi:hypothetical protein